MRPSTLLFVASLLGHEAFANSIITKIAPITHSESTSGLEARDTDWCAVIGRALDAFDKVPEQYKGWVLSSMFGGTGAYGVCRVLNHRPEDNAMCIGYGAAVSGIMGSVAVAVVNYHEMQPSGVSATKRQNSLISVLQDDLLKRGIEFESVRLMPIAARTEERRGDTSVSILGMRSDDGLVTDHILNFRSDGTGTATISVPSPDTDEEVITKRSSGPGFKMSYKFLVNSGSQIDSAAAKMLAVNFGRDWEARASASKEMSSYFGKAEFTGDHTMAFRISAMESSYDDYYEDVDACGVIS